MERQSTGLTDMSATEPARRIRAGEVERRFGEHFEIQKIAGETNYSKFPAGYAVYLMTRKERK